MSAGCSPARSMAALMETAPSSGERTELSEPIIPPIGVRAEPAITMSLFMDFVLLQQNLVCILVLPIGLVWVSSLIVWAPRLPAVRAGLRGGLFIFLEKELASLRHLFLAKNEKTTPRRRALAGSRLERHFREEPMPTLLTGG